MITNVHAVRRLLTLLAGSMLVVAAPEIAASRSNAAMPEHARAARFGGGWECGRGFRLIGENACAAVSVPSHGFLERSGDDWKCERGFKQADSSCTALKMPVNAYLGYSGNDWTCNDGFTRHGESCVASE